MQKKIDEIKGHYVVCGLGDTSRHAVEELEKTGTPFVAIEISEDNVKKWKELHPDVFSDMLYVIGDATEEEILEKAGIERAKGLITVLPHDKDNLVVTVVARQRFPGMRIVARSAEQKFSDRMLRAGANATVSPSRIGGLRMASEAIRPDVVGFLDLMLKEQSQTLRVEEIEIEEGSRWVGKTLGDLNIHRQYNLLVLAVKQAAGTSSKKLWVNPPESLTVQGSTAIIVMGDLKDIRQARHDARPALIAM
jgi:voltage-gated potassium channel